MTDKLPTPRTHERPNFDEKKVATAIKNIAKAADVADGQNDGIIHRAAATQLLVDEIKHPTALSRDAGLTPKLLASVLESLKSTKDLPDEMARPTNARIDEMVHAMGQQLNAHVTPKASVHQPQSIQMHGQAVRMAADKPSYGITLQGRFVAMTCGETIAGFQVPSWVPDAITTKTCRTK